MKKKIAALCLVVCLLATAIIGGTMAYFTDTTDPVTNTFTVGKVDITLTEPAWNPANAKLMPGARIVKNPTITVGNDSEDAWVFAEFTVGADLLDLIEAEAGSTTTPVATLLDKWFEGVPQGTYKVFKSEENDGGSYTYIIGFNNAMSKNGSVTLFDAVTVPATVTSKMLEDAGTGSLTLTIKAYAIQKENVASLDAAYTALFTPAP